MDRAAAAYYSAADALRLLSPDAGALGGGPRL
jgi:hypothetical protein